ncbi:transcription factor E4F1 [Dendroctonus ponderosae]|uniref:transcription factor E4F1 n=1 Tax=Dendroctonus ponderosae TaxID=77166 RepID=UPI002035D4F0|nr:transcription factor E4F1 [Dendroctonus ponderosae]
MSALEENPTQVSQLTDTGNPSAKNSEKRLFPSYSKIAAGFQNIPVKKQFFWKPSDSGDIELVGARLSENFCHRKEFPTSLAFFCDICGANPIERAIKLNQQERVAAKVVLKIFSRLDLRNIAPQLTPEKACSGCFTQITLFRKRIKEKLVKHKVKRTQNMNNHDPQCTCVNCYNQCRELWNPPPLQASGSRDFQNISAINPPLDLETLLPPIQTSYETQQEPMQTEFPSYAYQWQQTNFNSGEAAGYFAQQQSAQHSQQPQDVFSNIQSNINVPSTNLDEGSSLPVSLQNFESHGLRDRDQPSTSQGFTGQLEDEPNSRKIRKVCCHCSKEFTHTGDFKKHLRTHTKERPFSCLQCDKSFPHSSNLRRHQRSHINDRPYKCEHCAKEFNRKDKLVSHRKSKACKSRRHEDSK